MVNEKTENAHVQIHVYMSVYRCHLSWKQIQRADPDVLPQGESTQTASHCAVPLKFSGPFSQLSVLSIGSLSTLKDLLTLSYSCWRSRMNRQSSSEFHLPKSMACTAIFKNVPEVLSHLQCCTFPLEHLELDADRGRMLG